MIPRQARLLRRLAISLAIAATLIPANAADDEKNKSVVTGFALDTAKSVATDVIKEIISKGGAKQLARGEMDADAFKELVKSKIAENDKIKPVMMAVKTAAWWDTVLGHGFSAMDSDLQEEIFKWTGEQAGEILEKEAEKQYRRYVTVESLNEILKTSDRSLLTAMGQRANGPADELAKRINEKMAAYGSKIEWGKAGVAVFKKYAEEGWEGVRDQLAMNTTKALAEALFGASSGGIFTVAEWGSAAVEFMGNYILEYANQTKTESVIKELYGGWSGFAKYVMDHPNAGKAQLLADFKDRWERSQETLEYSGFFTGKSNDAAMTAYKVDVFKQLEAIADKMKPTLDALLEQQKVAKRNAEEARATEFKIKSDIQNLQTRRRTIQAKLTNTSNNLLRTSLTGATTMASPAALIEPLKLSVTKITVTEVAFTPPAVAGDLEAARSLEQLDKTAARLKADIDQAWLKFSQEFEKKNPTNVEQHPIWKQMADNTGCGAVALESSKGAKSDKELTAITMRNNEKLAACSVVVAANMEALRKEEKAYRERRAAYYQAASSLPPTLVQTIDSYVGANKSRITTLANQIRARAAAAVRAAEALRNPPLANGIAMGNVEVYESKIGSIPKDGAASYVGLPKLEFPKWGDSGLNNYIENWISRLVSIGYAADGSRSSAIANMLDACTAIERMQTAVDSLRQEAQAVRDLVTTERRFAVEIPDVSKELAGVDSVVSNYSRVLPRVPEWRTRYQAMNGEMAKAYEYLAADKQWFQTIQVKLRKLADIRNSYHVADATYLGNKVQVTFPGDHWNHNMEVPLGRDKVDQIVAQYLVPLEGLRKWDSGYNVGVVKGIEEEITRLKQALTTPHAMFLTTQSKGNVIVMPADFSSLTAEINSLKADQELAKSLPPKFTKGPMGLYSDGGLFAGAWPQYTIDVNLDNMSRIAKAAPDDQIRNAASALVTAINSKISEFKLVQTLAYDQQKKESEAQRKKSEDDMKKQNECLQKGGALQADGSCRQIASAPTQPVGSKPSVGTMPTGGNPGPMTATTGNAVVGPAGPPPLPPGSPTAGQKVSTLQEPGNPPNAGQMQQLQPNVVAGTSTPGTSPSGPAPGPGGKPPASTSSDGPSMQASKPSSDPPKEPNLVPPQGVGQHPASQTPPGPSQNNLASAAVPLAAAKGPASDSAIASTSAKVSAPQQQTTGAASVQAMSSAGDGGVGSAGSAPRNSAMTPSAPASARAVPDATGPAGPPTGPSAIAPQQAAKPPATGSPTKPVDKELEAQWKEMNKSDSKPPIAVSALPPAAFRPGAASPASGPSGASMPASPASAPTPAAAPTPDATPAVREAYQKFAEAYQRKDARGMSKYLATQWQGPGGLSPQDFEDGLANAFKTFDTIQFKMESLQVQKASADTFNVSYSAVLSGKSSKQNLKVDDKIAVQDVVKITTDGPRIVKTTGSIVMKTK